MTYALKHLKKTGTKNNLSNFGFPMRRTGNEQLYEKNFNTCRVFTRYPNDTITFDALSKRCSSLRGGPLLEASNLVVSCG